jgi:hypothetical protein
MNRIESKRLAMPRESPPDHPRRRVASIAARTPKRGLDSTGTPRSVSSSLALAIDA